MTISTTILNTGDSTDVDITSIPVVNKTDYALVDTVSKEDGTRESTYQKVSGNEEYPMAVRVGYYRNAKANDGVGSTNISVRVSSFAQKADDAEVLWTLPAFATLAISIPGMSGVPDNDDVTELLGNVLSWYLPIQAGLVTNLALNELKFGVTNQMLDHANSASS